MNNLDLILRFSGRRINHPRDFIDMLSSLDVFFDVMT
jgi:hypothetical protein